MKTMAGVAPPSLLIALLTCLFISKGSCVCNDICAEIYSPVCGSNYKTYSNDCRLEFDKCNRSSVLTKRYDGECQCTNSMSCTEEYSPWCGTNGKTYDNECYFYSAVVCNPNANLKLRHVGECPPDPSDPNCQSSRVCTAHYEPVCGSDSRTYGNPCTLLMANDCRVVKVQQVRTGECGPLWTGDHAGAARGALWSLIVTVSLVIWVLV